MKVLVLKTSSKMPCHLSIDKPPCNTSPIMMSMVCISCVQIKLAHTRKSVLQFSRNSKTSCETCLRSPLLHLLPIRTQPKIICEISSQKPPVNDTSMPSSHQFRVLARFQPFARQITAFNAENFTIDDRNLFARNTSRAIMMCALFTMLSAVFLFNCWLCVFKEHEWSQRSYPFAAALCLIQQFIVYVLMVSKNRRITGVLEQLQAIVEKR